MTQETKRAIYEEYNNGDKVKDIAARHGITASAVSHIAKKQGAGQRRPRKRDRGGEKAKVCPSCRRKITVTGAKFCCFCGADMRDEKDKLIERMKKAMELIPLLPSDTRDEVVHLFIDIEKELRK